MSRLAKKPINIPESVEIKIDGGLIMVKGPKGELKKEFDSAAIDIQINGKEISLQKNIETKESKALWGTYASHITNMIHGVSEGYEKKLIIEGVGFRAEVKGNNLEMALGFSHPIIVPIPDGLSVSVEKNVVSVSGIDKEMVGQFASTVRLFKKPEPYKGKGIRYEGEIVLRKQGKRAA